jgi:alkylated DNA repair dioxygenase AlkB
LPRTVKSSPADTVNLLLPPGSVLRMAGATQRLYRHDLPKTRVAVGPRINLTFRWIDLR